MGKIIQLDEALSNMIAAGEVVENMASVVKELCENALDAECTTIDIHLKDFGLKQIRVIDNGLGMDDTDLTMAFKRHATSKIKTHHDLYRIASLGFRGEALPSIASVSEMIIESSDGQATATKLTLKNGEITDKTLGALQQGTDITVKNLFYNTPARLKHLKSEQKELSYIVDYVNKIALSHPFVRFTLTHNNKPILKTIGDGSTLKILNQIYDHDIVKAMLSFEAKNAYFTITGYACSPLYSRSTRQHVTIITNKRLIKNTKIVSAIIDGYRTYLPVQKYPIVYMHIDVDPQLIDINIHPQKLEVKFTEERSLLTLIKTAIERTLQEAYIVPKVQKHYPKSSNQTKMTFNRPAKEHIEETDAPYNNTPTIDDKKTASQDPIPPLKPSNERVPDMDYIGQYRGTYLLFQNDDGFYMVDQHASAERVRYERYYERMRKKDATETPLLIPLKVHLSNEEIIGYEDTKETLKTFGLKTRLIDNHVVIESIPSWFHDKHEESYAETMIRTLLNEDDVHIGRIIDQLAKDLSCKHSIRANKYITKEEVDKLMHDLKTCRNPYTCPHGRPTIIHFTPQEIERMFKRIQS